MVEVSREVNRDLIKTLRVSGFVLIDYLSLAINLPRTGSLEALQK